MLNNYLFSSDFADKDNLCQHQDILYAFLKKVIRENIVIILDKNKNFLKKIYSEINELKKTNSDLLGPRSEDLRKLVLEIFNTKNNFGKTRVQEINVDGSNMETFCKNLIDNGIHIDAIIIADDEDLSIEGVKSIKLSDLQYHNIEEKRENIYDKGLVDLKKIGIEKTSNYLKKSIWNSDTIYLYDYHLQKIYKQPDNFLEWKTSFEFLLNIFSECKTAKEKIKLEITTPFPKKRDGEDIERVYRKSSNEILRLAKDKSDKIDCKVVFLDSRIAGSEYMHDRFLLLKSCIFGLGRGADFMHSNGEFKEGSLIKHEKIDISFFNKLRNFEKREFF